MGYESRLYVVQKSVFSDFGLKLAVVDLSSCGSKPSVFSHPVDYNVTLDSPNSYVFEDAYGDRLTDCTLDEAIEWLEKANQEVIDTKQYGGNSYRRFTMALGLLKAIQNEPGWVHETIRVIHYGY